MNFNHENYTKAGTDIDEVKRRNAESGMSYNEVKDFLAKTTGGRGTAIYSDTDIEAVKKKIHQTEEPPLIEELSDGGERNRMAEQQLKNLEEE